MPKLPAPPGVEVVRAITPAIHEIAAGTSLARVYFTGGPCPARWNEFRRFGPTGARFDHHFPGPDSAPSAQTRSILYCATAADTCLAEVYQETRRINRTRNAPWLAIFTLQRKLALLDLMGAFATRVGASMAINTGSRARAREWARTFYEAYDSLQGIYYPSSMNGGEPAIALTDRAERVDCLPKHPELNRALADDVLVDVLKWSAERLGYGLL